MGCRVPGTGLLGSLVAMPAFDELAPDQRAVLQLLLKQGKTYERDRRPPPPGRRERPGARPGRPGRARRRSRPPDGALPPERQDELADHLLLQQTASERAATQTFLEGSAPGRTWARGVRAELVPIGGDALPEIPAEPSVPPGSFASEAAADERDAASADERGPATSRLGGALVLAAVAATLLLGIFFLVRSGDGNDTVSTPSNDTTAQTTAGASGTSGAAGTSLPQQQINLTAPAKGSKALGYALLAPDGFSMLAEGLPESNMYLIWLYNSGSDAVPVGFATYDTATKRVAGGISSLPAGAEKYASVIVTRETSKRPTKPGAIVLRGAIKQN